MPKVSNDTDRPLKVIVAYDIDCFLMDIGPDGSLFGDPSAKWVDINDVPAEKGGMVKVSDDQVTWVLQPGDTQYVECRHTNDCIFSPYINAGMTYSRKSGRSEPWIVGQIDPDEHIHIRYYPQNGHWEISNNEGGGAHHSFIQ